MATPTPQKRTLYFAFGSNLSLEQMRHRCPTSRYYALSVLKGWKWLIGPRGYANVVHTEAGEDVVYGMLYWLEPRDEEDLDLAEGVPYSYVKKWLDVEIVSGEERRGGEKDVVNVLVYVDEKRTGEGKIREEYIHRMNRGIKDAIKVGMPMSYVNGVLRKWVKEEDGGDGDGDGDKDVEDPFHPEKVRSGESYEEGY